MSRVWARAVLAVAVVCLATGAFAASAMAKPKPPKSKSATPGRLDPSFGNSGALAVPFPPEQTGSDVAKYTLPFEFAPGHLQMAQAPGGKVVVAGATRIVRLLADGKLDPSFGDDGAVTVPRPPGAVFVLAGVAVDSLGRVVLAGLARPLPSDSTPDPLLSSAAVMRFNADGTPDASFGSGGVLVTDLGLTAPKAPGGPYLGPSVGLRDVAIDSQNRPVVSGAYVTAVGTAKESAESEPFVARLTETGALDPTFGEAGIRTIKTLDSMGQLVPWSAGYLALSERSERPRNLITGLDGNGNLDTSFASFGFRTLTYGAAPALTISPSGKLLLLGRPEEQRVSHKKKVKDKKTGKVVTKRVRVWIRVQTVQRLLPSGAGDPTFGRSGAATYNDPKVGSFAAIAVDGKERTYLAGRIGKGLKKKAGKGPHRTNFLLVRNSADGAPDRSFGKAGVVTTDFGDSSSAFATQVTVGAKGRILVGGGINSSGLETGSGFALARYLPGG